VACFGGGYGGAAGFEVTHFADHNDIGVLTQDAFEGGAEAWAVETDFTLFDYAHFVFEGVFDGVFEGDDVFAVFGIYDAEHRGECGAFACAGVSRNEDESAGQVGEFFNDWGKVQVIDVWNMIWNQTKSDGDSSSLVVSVDAESMAIVESG